MRGHGLPQSFAGPHPTLHRNWNLVRYSPFFWISTLALKVARGTPKPSSRVPELGGRAFGMTQERCEAMHQFVVHNSASTCARAFDRSGSVEPIPPSITAHIRGSHTDYSPDFSTSRIDQ